MVEPLREFSCTATAAVNAHHMLHTLCMCFASCFGCFTPVASHLVGVCMSAYAWRVVWSTVTRGVDFARVLLNTPSPDCSAVTPRTLHGVTRHVFPD